MKRELESSLTKWILALPITSQLLCHREPALPISVIASPTPARRGDPS
ncbi:hypothetical protein [Helicobacter canis]|nr:hypothetical protein [Helicobacter canis]